MTETGPMSTDWQTGDPLTAWETGPVYAVPAPAGWWLASGDS
jgi:hypothetical protein